MSIAPSGTGIDATCKCLSRFGLQVSFPVLLASSQLHRSRLNRTNEQPNNLKTWTPFGTAACVGCACFTITTGGPGPRLIEGERCAVWFVSGLWRRVRSGVRVWSGARELVTVGLVLR